jgi:hypothetical protein
LILSGNYVDQELSREFGKIPPSFLPVGEMRLFELQVEELKKSVEKIYLTLPNDFEIPEYDQIILHEMKVVILKCDPNLTIADALGEAITKMDLNNIDDLVLNYGDTLSRIPKKLNSLAGSPKPQFYNWGEFQGNLEPNDDEKKEKIVLVGMFRFKFISVLLTLLKKRDLSIVEILEQYISETEAEIEIVDYWLDFGHLSMYFESRKQLQQSRHFNSIEVIGEHVIKKSKDILKVNSEYLWYKTIPEEISIFVPRVTGKLESGYSTEYLRAPTLQELMVFSELDIRVWKSIFKSIEEYFQIGLLKSSRENQLILNQMFKSLVLDKSVERFSEINWEKISTHLEVNGRDLSIKAELAFTKALNYISNWDGMEIGTLHGDMCATNIFWDSLNRRIALIDPRGLDFRGALMNSGNIAYDVAKLYQSFVLDYEYVICSRYKLIKRDDGSFKVKVFKSEHGKKVSNEFLGIVSEMSKFDLTNIHYLAQLLLFSLIPLHEDRLDRQAAFLILAMEEELIDRNFA